MIDTSSATSMAMQIEATRYERLRRHSVGDGHGDGIMIAELATLMRRGMRAWLEALRRDIAKISAHCPSPNSASATMPNGVGHELVCVTLAMAVGVVEREAREART